MQTHSHLSHEKVKLALIFTIIIFLLMIGLEIASLTYKYIDFQNTGNKKLSMQIERITKQYQISKSVPIQTGTQARPTRESIEQGVEDILPPPMESHNEWFVIYDTVTKEILASPFNQTDFIQSVIAQVGLSKETSGTFESNDSTYQFIHKNIDASHAVIVFHESRFPIQDIADDLIMYLVFASMLSFGLYFLITFFIQRTLRPVEENMMDMEQFIYNAGHELKTPLAVAKSTLQIALAKENNRSNIEEGIEEINQINAIIESLIRLSTIRDEQEKTDVVLENIIDSVLKEYDTKILEKHLKISTKYTKNTLLFANEEYVKIVISNLLSNAIKYNKENGEISIVIGPKYLEIQDTGIGINPESLEKVFDRFFQDADVRNKDGWGIGLSLVRKIADMYQWKVRITSEKGTGTKVRIEF